MDYIANIHLALPEMVLLATACLALLADLFIKNKGEVVGLVIAIVGVALSGAIALIFLGQYSRVIFQGMYISDDIAHIMKAFIALTVIFCLIYSRDYLKQWQVSLGDFYVLALFSTLGMYVLVSGSSLLTIYLGLELLSLPLYAMTAMARSSASGAEASTKYFLMGAIASGLLLFGMSLLYGATGKLNLIELANAIALNWQQQNELLVFALVFIIVGIGFKLAAAPFHMWAPDVYDGAPSAITLFIASAPKVAALAMAIRLLTMGVIDLSHSWQQILLVMAILSAGFGNFIAVAQTNIKRLFAFSAISHSGYALFGLCALTKQGYSAALFYILIYALMSASAFGLIVLMSRQGTEVQDINDLKGLNQRNPWLAFLMMVTLFSMAGVPPTAGFFTKLLVLKALVDAHLVWVAVLGLLFAVVGAYYYLRIIKIMYFDAPDKIEAVLLPRTTQVAFSLNCLALLYFGFFPTGLINICINAFIN